MKNRNPIKQWFITFPQVGEASTKELFPDELPPSVYYIICEEEHKDGNKHLHIATKLKKGISHSNLVKWLKAKFPDDWKRIHFEAIKNMDASVDYCKKEDPYFVEVGDYVVKKRMPYSALDAERDVHMMVIEDMENRRNEKEAVALLESDEYRQMLWEHGIWNW